MTSRVFEIHEPSQVAFARREAAALAASFGFTDERAGRVALIVSELASNLAKHARDGQILLNPLYGPGRPHGRHPYASSRGPAASPGRTGVGRDPAPHGIEILSIDRGPGLQDIREALRDGHSTAGSLGFGLGAVVRQADAFDIFSQVRAGATHARTGTIVLARVWSRAPARADVASRASGSSVSIGAISVAIKGESVSGDGWAAHVDPAHITLLVVDGLGHGPAAAEAASTAVDAFDHVRTTVAGATTPVDAPAADAPPLERTPTAYATDLHEALRPTRGAALAVLQLDTDRSVVRYAGLGNISGVIVTPDLQRRTMISRNGTAGHIANRVEEYSYPLPRHATVVLHSDGLTSQWNPADYPGLWSRDPALIAAILYRDCSRGRDDVTVVVLHAHGHERA